MSRISPAVALVIATIAGVSWTAPASARGRIYWYVDGDGKRHFTNLPHDSRFQPFAFTRPDPLARNRVPRRGGSAGRPPQAPHYDGLIDVAAREHRVQPALVKAVIAAESNFDPRAVSHKGAQGLMQLMPRTAAQLGVENPFEPAENVRGGARYLRDMLDRYGDVSRALAAYNAGPAAVDRYGGIPPYPETRDYVQRVLTYYRHYDGDFGR